MSIRKFLFCSILLNTLFITAFTTSAFCLFTGNLSDSEISSAIESDLFIDEAVPSSKIDVETKDGIVILSGTVDNLLAEERAVKVAETIKGVRSVINQIKVSPAHQPDGEIRTNILKAMEWDPAVDSNEINVSVKDGVVTFTGKVDSWQEKQIPNNLAKGVSGVKDIVNNIAYHYESNRPDREIQADIRRRLESDIWIYASMIRIKVTDGQVNLSGGVGSVMEKQRTRNFSWVAGVKDVDASALNVISGLNDETKRPAASLIKSDQEIKAAILDAFIYDTRIDPNDIDVNVDKRFVVLSGIVDHLGAKIAAENDASNTVGVWGIKNNIEVSPLEDTSDENIADHVKDALAFHPFIYAYPIKVDVIDNTVRLSGTVDSVFDKKRAEDVAGRIAGVKEIENHLIVSSTWPFKEDLEIQESIEKEYFWSIYVDESNIQVNVEHGRADLQGRVNNWGELKAAVKNAFEGGARSVETHIRIEHGMEDLYVHNIFTYEDVQTWP